MHRTTLSERIKGGGENATSENGRKEGRQTTERRTSVRWKIALLKQSEKSIEEGT
jgi:hypothetical protein